MTGEHVYRGVVIGGSAGGVEALVVILAALPADFRLPLLVVQHLHASDDGAFSRHLAHRVRRPVMEPCDKQPIEPGQIYTAPANYHMLVEKDDTISLSVDDKVNYSRPSIDVLFESAAHAWGTGVIAVILSGANNDGTEGMRKIKAVGGLNIAQDPDSAETQYMVRAAIDSGVVDEVLLPEKIGKRLMELAEWSDWGRDTRFMYRLREGNRHE